MKQALFLLAAAAFVTVSCLPPWAVDVGNNATLSCSKRKCHKANAKGGGSECCSGCCIDWGKHIQPELTCNNRGQCTDVCRKENDACDDYTDCCTKNTFNPPGCCKGEDCSECKGSVYSFVMNCKAGKCLACAGLNQGCSSAPGGCCGGKDSPGDLTCCGGAKGNVCGGADGMGLGQSGGPYPNTVCPNGKNSKCCSGLCYQIKYVDPISYWACGVGPGNFSNIT